MPEPSREGVMSESKFYTVINRNRNCILQKIEKAEIENIKGRRNEEPPVDD